MMPSVSIIIPVYNIASWLGQCVDSILQQTLTDWEMILVDDGSTDASASLCDHYATIDARIRLLHKENGGLSDARNAGLAIATGKYVYYLDGDDYLAPHAIQLLHAEAENNHSDLVCSGFYYTYPSYQLLHKKYSEKVSPLLLSPQQAMEALIEGDWLKNFAWGCLLRKELADQVPFIKGKYYEDIYWKHLIIHHAATISFVPAPLYYYRQRETGISGTFSLKNIDLLTGSKARLAFIKRYYPILYGKSVYKHWELARMMYKAAVKNMSCGELLPYREYLTDAEKMCSSISGKEKKLRMILVLFFQSHASFFLPFLDLTLRILDRLPPSCYKRIPLI